MIEERYTANHTYQYANYYMIAKWNSDAPLSLSGIQTKHAHTYSFCAEISEIDALSLP